MVDKILDVQRTIPFSSEASISIDIPNTHDFDKIIIKHNIGSLTGGSSGSYVANTLIKNIRLEVAGNVAFDLTSDQETDGIPYGIQALREAYKLQHKGQAMPSENWILEFPTNQGLGSNARLTIYFSSLANINDGDRTAYSGTIDVITMIPEKKASKIVRLERKVTKFAFGANSGYLSNFVSPNTQGFTMLSMLLIVEDSGTPSNTKISRLRVLDGANTIVEGSVTTLQTKALQFGTTHATGMVLLDVKRKVYGQQLVLESYISSAGTAIDMHVLITSIRA